MSPKLQTVHVRINDKATGQPTPCRVRFSNEQGETFPPFGRTVDFPTGRNLDVGGNLLLGMKPYAYIDGACEVRLPVGKVQIEIAKGPEFVPQRLQASIGPGKLALRLAIERWADWRSEGWYSGDIRCHFLSPHAALLEAQAEDLAVVNLLASELPISGSHGRNAVAIPNILAFSGQHPALEQAGHMVAVNTYNSNPVLGGLALLHCHRIIFPLSFGGPEKLDDWTMLDWCDQCHRKRGLVVWTKTAHESPTFRYGEPLADLILGKIDAFEIDSFEDSPFDVLSDWYLLLNCGYSLPLVGASGKENNGMAMGSMRTYARLQERESFTYSNWIEAIRAGRTFATNGPLISFQVDGEMAGTALRLDSPRSTLHVRAEASSIVPFDRLEVIVDGRVAAKAESEGTPASACLEADVPVSSSGWIAARCLGSHQLFHRPANQRVFAHTSPVYIRMEGRSPAASPEIVAALARHLDGMADWARTQARCETDQQRERLVGIFLAAKKELHKRGAGPA
ncbi:MAG: CehA/McbA family metallohydrolase [Gemmataceae bacterium]